MATPSSYTAESFTLSGGYCRVDDDEVAAELSAHGLSATASNGVVTVTLPEGDIRPYIGVLDRIAQSARAKVVYTASDYTAETA